MSCWHWRFLWAVSCGVTISATFYWLFFIYPQYMHSDSAAYLLLGEDMLRTASWLSPQWNYVSDGLSIADGGQVAALMVGLFGLHPLSLSAAGAVATLMLMFAISTVGRQLGLALLPSVVAGVLAVSGVSVLYLDMLLGYTIAIVVAQSAIFVGLVAGVTDGRSVRWRAVVAAFLMFILFAANPRKAFAFTLFPSLFAAGVCFLAWRVRGAEVMRQVGLRGFTRWVVLASIGGWAAHKMLSFSLQVNKSYAIGEYFLGFEQARANAAVFLRLLGYIYGINTADGQGWAAMGGGKLVVGLLFLACLIWVGFRALKLRQWAWLFLAAYVVGAFVAISAALILGEPIKEHYGIYYVIYPLVLMPVFVVSALSDIKVERVKVSGMMLVLFVLLSWTPGLIHSEMKHYGHVYLGPRDSQTTNNQEKRVLIDWLQEKGFHLGYAPFWEANAMTVLSEGRVRTVPGGVLFNGAITPMYWLVSNSHIDLVSRAEKSFLVLYDTVWNQRVAEQCFSTRTERVGPYLVVLFDGDLSMCRAK